MTDGVLGLIGMAIRLSACKQGGVSLLMIRAEFVAASKMAR